MIAHAAQGGLGGEYFGTMFHGRDAVVETRLLRLGYCVVALILSARMAQQADGAQSERLFERR